MIEEISYVAEKLSISVSVADPSLPDAPLVYVNPAFCELSQYDMDQVIGLNCRFLQGNLQNQPGLETIRNELKSGQTVFTCLKNFKRDGTPFQNLLYITSVQFSPGERLLLGCQFELSKSHLSEFEFQELWQRGDLEVRGGVSEKAEKALTHYRTLALSVVVRVRSRATLNTTREMKANGLNEIDKFRHGKSD